MKNKIIYIVIAVLLAGGGALWFAGSNNASPQPASPAGGPNRAAEQFAGFSLKDYSGKTVTSDQFRGKPLVINSWASWCPFCKAELPALADAQDEFKGRVAIVAIDRGEPLGVAQQYSDAGNIAGRLVLLLDPADSFYQSIGGFSMPETIFVDKNGTIVEHKRGPMDINEIRQKISNLL